jgi:sporulation protein YlmC with PRC-barrel domain
MEKITDILFAEVETEDGEKLGRVYDIRSHGEPECGFPNRNRPLDELLCGRTGLFELLGFKKVVPTAIPWSSVKTIEPGRVIIRSAEK